MNEINYNNELNNYGQTLNILLNRSKQNYEINKNYIDELNKYNFEKYFEVKFQETCFIVFRRYFNTLYLNYIDKIMHETSYITSLNYIKDYLLNNYENMRIKILDENNPNIDKTTNREKNTKILNSEGMENIKINMNKIINLFFWFIIILFILIISLFTIFIIDMNKKLDECNISNENLNKKLDELKNIEIIGGNITIKIIDYIKSIIPYKLLTLSIIIIVLFSLIYNLINFYSLNNLKKIYLTEYNSFIHIDIVHDIPNFDKILLSDKKYINKLIIEMNDYFFNSKEYKDYLTLYNQLLNNYIDTFIDIPNDVKKQINEYKIKILNKSSNDNYLYGLKIFYYNTMYPYDYDKINNNNDGCLKDITLLFNQNINSNVFNNYTNLKNSFNKDYYYRDYLLSVKDEIKINEDKYRKINENIKIFNKIYFSQSLLLLYIFIVIVFFIVGRSYFFSDDEPDKLVSSYFILYSTIFIIFCYFCHYEYLKNKDYFNISKYID